MTRSFAHALRPWVRQPFLAATAVASLAIGIGANITIFSAANAILLAPTAGVADPGRLVDIGLSRANASFDTMSYPTFADLRDRNHTVEAMFAHDIEPKALSLGGGDGAQRVYGEVVSANFFDVLGVRAAAGDTFHGADEHLGTPLRRVVLSDRFWRRGLGANPAVIGAPLVLNGEPFTVTGVAPRAFQGTTILAPDVWVPLTAYARALPTDDLLHSRHSQWLVAVGRLKAGASIAAARADLGAIADQIRASDPEALDPAMRPNVQPLSRVPGEAGDAIAPIVGVLGALVGLVLLVACTNLAGLLLARAAGRSREMAVRVALGATRWGLIRILLAESAVLFAAGGGAALLLALWLTRAMHAMLPSLPVPVNVTFTLDWRVIVFAFGVALVSGLCTGLVPALHSSRVDLTSTIKADQRTPARQRLRYALIAAQLAFCLLLLVVAGLLLRSLTAAAHIEPGMRLDGVDAVSVDLSLGNYPEETRSAAAASLAERFGAIPGVARVGVGGVVPLDGGSMSLADLRAKGTSGPGASLDADWNVISPDYLPALDIPIARGRNFTRDDRAGGTRVVIVNQRFAAHAWPNQDPIGQQLEVGDFRPAHLDITDYTVIGVSRDAKYRWIGEQPRAAIYVPLTQQPWQRLTFFVARDRAAADTPDLTAAFRAALHAFDPNLPLITVRRLRDVSDVGLLPQRISATIAGALGLLAMGLGAIGLYGVMSVAVAQRTREIGVRMALGADAGDVVRMVLAQGLRLAAIGGAIGAAAAAGAGIVLANTGLLFHTSPFDPLAFGGTIALVGAIAALATYVPARRAAATDPTRAIRQE